MRRELVERADVGDLAFNSEVQLEPHLERGGPLLSRLVTGYNHTINSERWMTFQDRSPRVTSEDVLSLGEGSYFLFPFYSLLCLIYPFF